MILWILWISVVIGNVRSNGADTIPNKAEISEDWIQKILLCDTLADKDNETFKSYLYQDQCLKRVDTELNWTAASTFCQERYQGNLVAIRDEGMNSEIDRILSYSLDAYWTGGIKIMEEDTYIVGDGVSWRWPGDDEAMTYTSWNWALGQPDNAEGIEDRIAFWQGEWDDTSANNENRLICSKKASPEKSVHCGSGSMWRFPDTGTAMGCHNCRDADSGGCGGECFWLAKSKLCVPVTMSDIPETYHTTGDIGGLTRERHSNILGQYDLVATSYRNITVLIYKKNTTEHDQVFWMFNVTDRGDWVVGSDGGQEIFLRTSVPGHGLHAPTDNWKLSIKTADRSYRLVDDTSLTVRAEIDCLWGSWVESDCSKECGGGYKNFTRHVIKRAIKNGECPGASWRVEHCNMMMCPTQITILMATVTIVAVLIVLASCHRRKAKSTFENFPSPCES